MAELQVKPQEDKIDLSNNTLTAIIGLVDESVRPTVSRPSVNDDFLEFLDNDFYGHNSDTNFLDLTLDTGDNSLNRPRDPSIFDLGHNGSNVFDFLDLTEDSLTDRPKKSYPGDTSILDLSQTIEDLSNSNTEPLVTLQQEGKNNPPKPLFDPVANSLFEMDVSCSSSSSRKHKLPLVSEYGGSASKSVKKKPTTNLELGMPFAACVSSETFNIGLNQINSPAYSSNKLNACGGFSQPSIAGSHHFTRNHTVTSADVSMDTFDISCKSGPSKIGPDFEAEVQLKPVDLPKTQDFLFSVRPRPIDTNEVSRITGPHLSGIRPRPMSQLLEHGNNLADRDQKKEWPSSKKSESIVGNIDYPTKVKSFCTGINVENKSEYTNDSPVFYQTLEMFPDIDENFLRTICQRINDLNQIIDCILEKNNNYPKVSSYKLNEQTISKPCVKSKQTGCVDETSTLPTNLCLYSGKTAAMPENKTNKEVRPVIIHEHDKYLESAPTRPTVESDNHTELTLFEDPSIFPLPVNGINSNVLGVTDTEQNDEIKKFDFLIKIFPDADPEFLQRKCKLGEIDIRTFVSEALEKNDYPKVVIKVEKNAEDNKSDLGLYTNSFDVEKFLNILPEPFQYFFDEKRICVSNQHCIEFMKGRYRNHAIKLINKKYSEYKFNLARTCEFLDAEKPSRATKRCLQEINMPNTTNLPFMQEACFVEHKNEIKNFFDSREETRKLAYLQAEQKGELTECGCCYDKFLFEECAACNEGDLFCKTCIQKSAEVRIGDGFTTFPCLLACGSEFSLQMLQDLMDAQVFSRLLKRIQLDEVKAADIEGLEICPFCEFATIPPPETNIFTCLNPECLKESCRKCHKLSHIPQRCEEIENDDQERARKYIEDEMTKALVRQCHSCKKNFIKSDGCNKMTCSCGAKMCYICRQPITDYKHFNGPGGVDNKKCPLYSTEQVLHVDAVKAVAEKTLKKLKEDNPDLKLKHDPTKILPKASPASRTLPPGVNEVPQQLMEVLFRNHIGNADFHR